MMEVGGFFFIFGAVRTASMYRVTISPEDHPRPREMEDAASRPVHDLLELARRVRRVVSRFSRD